MQRDLAAPHQLYPPLIELPRLAVLLSGNWLTLHSVHEELRNSTIAREGFSPLENRSSAARCCSAHARLRATVLSDSVNVSASIADLPEHQLRRALITRRPPYWHH
jgi:hypothetical protein